MPKKTKNPLDILKVVDPPNIKHRALNPNLPQPPSLVLMIMPTKTGKSTIASNLLLNKNFYGADFFDEYIVISPTINNDLTSRFLKQSFNTFDYYDDSIIHDIVKTQGKVEKKDQKSICLFVDDCLGEKTTALNNLSSRYRHSSIDLFILSSQLLKKVSPTIRANANWVLCGRLQNQAELDKLSEEYNGMFGGDTNFREYYAKATKKQYDFMTLKLTENPAEIWKNFTEKLYPLNTKEESESESESED
tara:strand:- start:529 stop:1272 length:744 start_codon:yes stop_codon:yes gene_type:complete